MPLALLSVAHPGVSFEDLHELVDALTAALDAKHGYTAGHSSRVADFSLLLATHLGYSLNECQYIHIAGHLHDIGKMGIADSVLEKEGALTLSEFDEIRRHPVIGAEILSKVPSLFPFIDAVRSHHERWDGKGYPDCLAGEAIPPFARIVSLSDAWDAMTSDRSYRASLSKTEALSRILEGSGTQFDPAVVAVFQKLEHEGLLP